MASMYFKSRVDAGNKILETLGSLPGAGAVISLSCDAALVANQIAQALKCPLQLYLEETIDVPGGLDIGSVNQDGQFHYSSDLSSGYQDYFYQEFRNYIDDSKRSSFAKLNRELMGRETIRHDLLRDRDIFIVSDCLSNLVGIDGLIQSLKSVSYKSISVCSPIAMSKDYSQIDSMTNRNVILGLIDFFYGVDHYYEDNSTLDRDQVISSINDTLKLWPIH